MKILYIANVRLPTEKAHGIQIMKTCEALVRAGATVELVVPTRTNPITESAFAYYAMPDTFPITYVPVPDTVGTWGRFGFLIQTVRFARAAERYAKTKEYDVIYGRDERVLDYLAKHGHVVVWETHTGAWNAPARSLSHKVRALVTISNGLRTFYIERGIAPECITIAPDGVDLTDFDTPKTKTEVRARFGLGTDTFIAAYIGRLNAEKGAPTFFKASEFLPATIQAVAIGGTDEDLCTLPAQYPKVRFLGSRPYRELPDNQAMADVLILPNSAQYAVSAEYTSPLKLFTAMASGVPIIASDVPSIREVLDDSMAYLIPADNPEALAEAIQHCAAEPAIAQEKARVARIAVEEYTWDTRATKILAAV